MADSFVKKLMMKYLAILPVMLLSFFQVYAQWDSISRYPSTATDGAISFTINGKGYVGAGLADNHFYSFNPSNGMWTKMADIPSDGGHRAWAFSFVIDGKGYIGGGSYASASDISDDTWMYDPKTNKWTQKADYPAGNRDGFFSFSIGNKGYVGGGFDGAYIRSDFYEYNAENDKWRKLSDFPGGAVLFGCAFVINGKAYVGTGGQGTHEIQTFYEFDPATEKWTKKANFKGGIRQAAVAFSIGDKGYIGGGMTGYQSNYSDCWAYNSNNDSWTKVNDILPTKSTAWSTAFVIDNTVYVGTGVMLPDFNFSNSFYTHSFENALSIENFSPAELSIYPNPANDKLNVNLNSPIKNGMLEIRDLKGRIIKTFEIKSNNVLEISNLNKGVYFITIKSDQQKTTKIFLKL